jgi:hypothetical protein
MEIHLNGMLVNIPTDVKTSNHCVYPKEVLDKALQDYLHKMKIEDRIKKIKKLQNGRISKM